MFVPPPAAPKPYWARGFGWAAWVYRGSGGFALVRSEDSLELDPRMIEAFGQMSRVGRERSDVADEKLAAAQPFDRGPAVGHADRSERHLSCRRLAQRAFLPRSVCGMIAPVRQIVILDNILLRAADRASN